MKYYLYNSKANNGIKPDMPDNVELKDAVGLDYKQFFDSLAPEDEVVFIGGDGTLNYLINTLPDYDFKNKIYLHGNGTGNDFFNDLGKKPGDEVLVNEYLNNLPTVEVNGKKQLFLNNMGFGIDGYCCEIADKIKIDKPNEEINYPGIAIKGLLFHFKPRHASVVVDGKKYEFDNVWIAPTMKGSFYGGGMNMAPDQNRKSDHLTLVIYMTKSKLKALKTFPSIFKGEHIQYKDIVKVLPGKDIEVKFSQPCAAQIDGETVLNVTKYHAYM